MRLIIITVVFYIEYPYQVLVLYPGNSKLSGPLVDAAINDL